MTGLFDMNFSKLQIPDKLKLNAEDDSNLSPLSKWAYLLMLRIIYLLIIGYNMVHAAYRIAVFKKFSYNYRGVRSPDQISTDIASLPKIPRHIAAMLKVDLAKNGIDKTFSNIGDLAYWTMSAGSSVLTIYEHDGVLKRLGEKEIMRRLSDKLTNYYGNEIPSLKIKIAPFFGVKETSMNENFDLTVFFVDESDGRPATVELTREYAREVIEKRLSAKDITVEKVHHDMMSEVFDEPDIVIVFGPRLELDGFPPWQMRLAEIFNLPNINEISYPVFLRALESYAGCKINLGS